MGLLFKEYESCQRGDGLVTLRVGRLLILRIGFHKEGFGLVGRKDRVGTLGNSSFQRQKGLGSLTELDWENPG